MGVLQPCCVYTTMFYIGCLSFISFQCFDPKDAKNACLYSLFWSLVKRMKWLITRTLCTIELCRITPLFGVILETNIKISWDSGAFIEQIHLFEEMMKQVQYQIECHVQTAIKFLFHVLNSRLCYYAIMLEKSLICSDFFLIMSCFMASFEVQLCHRDNVLWSGHF